MNLFLSWLLFLATFLLGGVVVQHWIAEPTAARQRVLSPAHASAAIRKSRRPGSIAPRSRPSRLSSRELTRLCRSKAAIKIGGFRPMPLVHPAACPRKTRRRR